MNNFEIKSCVQIIGKNVVPIILVSKFNEIGIKKWYQNGTKI